MKSYSRKLSASRMPPNRRGPIAPAIPASLMILLFTRILADALSTRPSILRGWIVREDWSGAIIRVGTLVSSEEDDMSIFPTRILLATDGSTEAELATGTAVDLARMSDSELH